MRRRRFVGCLLRAGVLLPFSFFQERVAGAAVPSSRASILLSQLGSPWSFAELEFTKQIKTHRGLKPSTFPGYVIRLPEDVGKRLGLPHSLYAVSRICPHEGCPINFYKHRHEVPFSYYVIEVQEFSNPLLICTCHQSVFDPAQGGKVLSGPAPRPPWTFDFAIEKGRIIIKDLEPGGEKWG